MPSSELKQVVFEVLIVIFRTLFGKSRSQSPGCKGFFLSSHLRFIQSSIFSTEITNISQMEFFSSSEPHTSMPPRYPEEPWRTLLSGEEDDIIRKRKLETETERQKYSLRKGHHFKMPLVLLNRGNIKHLKTHLYAPMTIPVPFTSAS